MKTRVALVVVIVLAGLLMAWIVVEGVAARAADAGSRAPQQLMVAQGEARWSVTQDGGDPDCLLIADSYWGRPAFRVCLSGAVNVEMLEWSQAVEPEPTEAPTGAPLPAPTGTATEAVLPTASVTGPVSPVATASPDPVKTPRVTAIPTTLD